LASLRIAEEGYLMRFAVIGSQGMFGSELVLFLKSHGQQVQGFNRDNINLDSSIEEIVRILSGFDVVINAVGYTAVDKAESEPELANRVNGEYPEKLAMVSKSLEARFFHISTDYVFDGFSTTPYKTIDPRNPQGAYGRSKALGEEQVESSGANYTIFRTAWLYGAHGNCFPKTMFQKASQGQVIKVVSDQIGQPTWTKDLAELVFAYSKLERSVPVVHGVSSGEASWFDFAKEIVGDYPVSPVLSNQFVTAAKRPAFSVLDNSSKFVKPIGDWRERWRQAKAEVLKGITKGMS
jgi:dTDP-4-dehydrorhamnose reductase